MTVKSAMVACVEVCLLPTSVTRPEALHANVLALVRTAGATAEGQLLEFKSDALLTAHVRHVRVFGVSSSVASPSVHVHQLFDEEPAEEDAGDGESVAFQLFTLPALEFDGLWESLVYEDEVQPQLLRYVSTAMAFSAAGVDNRVIAVRR